MSFKLTVVSPEKIIWRGNAHQLTVPGADGELTVLGNHEPLITSLRKGRLLIRPEEGTIEEIAIQAGMLEISHNQATVLL